MLVVGSERGYVQLYSSEGEMLDSWHPHEKMVKVAQKSWLRELHPRNLQVQILILEVFCDRP